MFAGILLTSLISQTVPAQAAKTADLVVTANVRTMTSGIATAEAIAVSGGRISAIGRSSEIKRLIGPKTRVIDARGRLLIPGFNDAHVHFMGIGNAFSTIDLRGAKTEAAITEEIARYLRFLPKGRWILGGHWSGITPDPKTINSITPENPVFLYHADAKTAFANDVALKFAGIRGDGVDRGIVRGEALRKIAAIVPVSHTRNWAEIAETATSYAASLGVTSVQDMHSDDAREVYRVLMGQGKLKTRVYDCIPLSDWKKLVDRRDDDEMVRGGCLKSFSDGDDEAAPKLLRDVITADKAGLQIMVHAIGSSANAIVLAVFERTAKTNGRRDRRFRVEHAHNPRYTDLSRFSRSSIIASMQPHLFEGGTGGYYATLLRQRTHLAFGSDASITDLDPLLGIHAAVNAGAESISVYEAVRAYTLGSAYAEFQEKQKGTIEVGKLADFVILSEDIFALNAPAIRDTTVVMTVVSGKVVYEK